jgi:hypothetical protein
MVPKPLEVGMSRVHLETAMIGHSQWMPSSVRQDSMLTGLNSTAFLEVPLVRFSVCFFFFLDADFIVRTS